MDQEKALLFREICRRRAPTRRLLARRLSLRPSSVSAAIQELLDDGLVTERAVARQRSGRPDLLIAPRPNRLVAISLYVDSRELKAVLLNLDEEVLHEEARVVSPKAGNVELTDAVVDLLQTLPRRVPRGSRLAGASLSLVGTVNARTRTWVNAARWPKLSNLDLRAVEQAVPYPVLLRRTNDAELEYQLESLPEARDRNALLLHWGFGIGSAVSLQGELLDLSTGQIRRDRPRAAGSRRDRPCLCGSRGCLETVAALWALLPALRKRLGSLPRDERDLAPRLGDPGVLAVPELQEAFSAVRDALLVLYKVFYPDIVFLSGPFTENPAVFERLSQEFHRALPAYARAAVTVRPVPAGMPGCRLGGANPVFRRALGSALRRRP